MSENLWGGALPVIEADKVPMEYFREQAAALTKMTGSVLVGRANAYGGERKIVADLQVRVPNLQDYSMTIAEAKYSIQQPYPCTLVDPIGQRGFEVKSPTEFASRLSEILGSDLSRRTMTNLLKTANAATAN